MNHIIKIGNEEIEKQMFLGVLLTLQRQNFLLAPPAGHEPTFPT